MPTQKRRLTALILTVLGGLLLISATASAATNFGSRLNQDPTEKTCDPLGTCTIVSYIHPSDPEGDPYSGGAPVSGVITKFRVRAFADGEPGQITFRLADINLPDPKDDSSALATAAGTGPTVTIQPEMASETPITEVGGRLSVKKGQHLAIDATKSIGAVYNSSGDKFSYVYSPPLADGSGARGSNDVTAELLVAATIEPDADGDGFGDETQDQCPTQKSTQGACDTQDPGVSGLTVDGDKIAYTLSEAATVRLQLAKKVPGRKVGKKCVRQTAGNKGKKRCASFKNIGARFDGPGKKGANKVTLPNGKKLKPGVYKLTVTATDAAGNVTTKSTTFKVKKKKKR